MDKINLLLIANKTLIYSFIRAFQFSSILGKIYINESPSDFHFFNNKNINFINFNNITNYVEFIKQENINLVILNDIIMIQNGWGNFFKYNLELPVIGITKYWAQLETSKIFAKEFMENNNISTPEYSLVHNLKELKISIKKYGFPIVLKDDGLKAGFGSYICKDEEECLKIAKKLLKQKKNFIAEKFIKGEEVTLHTIWDGKILLPLEPVRDYKKLKNNNEGINTGSMGCYTPVKITSNQKNMIDEYVKHLESVFKKFKPNFTGIFASDLLFTNEKLYNLEFNMRLCTPEFEVLVEHIEDDLLQILYDASMSNLSAEPIKYKKGVTGAVNIVHKDYVKHSFNKKEIYIPQEIFMNNENIKVNANITKTNKKDKYIILPFLKILTLIKNDIVNPFPSIYNKIERIKEKNIYYRTDIGSEL